MPRSSWKTSSRLWVQGHDGKSAVHLCLVGVVVEDVCVEPLPQQLALISRDLGALHRRGSAAHLDVRRGAGAEIEPPSRLPIGACIGRDDDPTVSVVEVEQRRRTRLPGLASRSGEEQEVCAAESTESQTSYDDVESTVDHHEDAALHA